MYALSVIINLVFVVYVGESIPLDGKAHVGIENVRSRLEKLCGGQLEIESQLRKGTTAVITIPKEEGRPE